MVDAKDLPDQEFETDTGHLVPRKMRPPPLETPRVMELAWGQSIGQDPDLTIIACMSCRTPIFSVRVLDHKSHQGKPGSLTTETKPLGDWKVPGQDDSHCPVCHGLYREYNPGTTGYRYLTSRGRL